MKHTFTFIAGSLLVLGVHYDSIHIVGSACLLGYCGIFVIKEQKK